MSGESGVVAGKKAAAYKAVDEWVKVSKELINYRSCNVIYKYYRFHRMARN